MAKEVERFTAFKKQCQDEKKKEPKADGVLVFDEVKVISRLMWNSRSKKIIGLEMSSEAMPSLHDVYQFMSEGVDQTSYILQFLWRDLTSSFDVIGPYFTSSSSLETKFILSCVYKSIRLFHLYLFNTSVLVCDGASSNVSALKSTCGYSGAFGVQPSSVGDESLSVADRHSVKPWFTNPFNPEKTIFWIICPSHQVST